MFSLSIHIDRSITNTGDEKMIVVESPNGSLEKDVKIKSNLNPPVIETKNRIRGTHFSLDPMKDIFL